MAKKNISASAEKLGEADVKTVGNCVKFICEFPDCHFMMKRLGDDGKPTFHTDANGNSKLPDFDEFHFMKIPVKNKEGKLDPSQFYSIFIVDPEKHGKNYQRILDLLSSKTKNPKEKMYFEDDHFKKRNPEAFTIAEDKLELETKIEEKDRQIEELKKKLGFK
jgi:hypothetical protein